MTSLTTPVPVALAGTSGGKSWTNWAGNVEFKPQFFTAAQTLREVADIVRTAKTIRVAGGGQSCAPCVGSAGTVIDISALKHLLAIDYEQQRIVAGAGMTIRSLASNLAPLGYMLQNQPDSLDATIGGCIANAAHGTGMGIGSLSDANTLLGVQLILANGTIRELSSENEDDQELLSAVRTSLGSLGVVTQVTLRVKPLVKMVYHGRVLSRSEALSATMWKENTHYDLAWIPHTETYYGVTRNPTSETTPRKDVTASWWEDTVFNYARLKKLVDPSGKNSEKTVDAMTKLAASLEERRYVDRGDHGLGGQQRLRALTMEYAVPIDRLSDALLAVQEQTRDAASKDEFYLDLPVRIRFGPSDQGTLLSPSAGRETAYVELATLMPLERSARFFRSVEFRLLQLEGRPHWGKLFWKSPLKRYSEAERFRQIQNRLDPQGKFINPFMVRILTGRDLTDLHSPPK